MPRMVDIHVPVPVLVVRVGLGIHLYHRHHRHCNYDHKVMIEDIGTGIFQIITRLILPPIAWPQPAIS